jgi:hypothetical protein
MLSLLDWRRQIRDLYAEVRRTASDDPAGAHRLWCERRDDLYRNHEQSPVADRAAFGGLTFFEYDPAWRVEAEVQEAPAQTLTVQSSTGEEMVLDRLGFVEVPGGTLDVHWINVYGGGVFLPIRDGTSGHTTYGAGRYVLDTVKGADLGGALIVDFNFSYAPSCAFDPRWSCPLALLGNRSMSRSSRGATRLKPFRFAPSDPQRNAGRVPEVARRLEGLGYATLQTADPLLASPIRSSRSSAQLMTTTSGARPARRQQRAPQPGLLARQAATVDLLTDGRLERARCRVRSPSTTTPASHCLPRERVD